MEYGRIVLGSALILLMIFAPGIALCYAIFPKKDELNIVERVGLSFILGLTPTFVLYILEKNFMIPLTRMTATTAIALITLAGFITYEIRKPAS